MVSCAAGENVPALNCAMRHMGKGIPVVYGIEREVFMGFWIFMLFMDMMMPLMMIVFGKWFLKSAPKEINIVFGYRTSMSMKNKDTWDFAHRSCGKLWCRCGAAMLPVSVAAMLFAMGKNENVTGTVGGIVCAVQTIILIVSIYLTEKALKKNFDRSGKRYSDHH